MDEMTYNYDKVTVSITLQQNTSITYSLLNLQSNKLYKVDDNVNATFYEDDIDGQAAGNYSYDNLGNLIQDDAEEIDEIKWTNSGKIKSVKRVNTSAKADLHFGYDEAGQRLWKLVIPKEEILPASNPKTYKNKKQEYWDTTWYLGSARYSVQHVRNTNVPDDLYKQWILEELEIVGEKRHGLYKPQEVIGQRNFIVNTVLDYNEDGTFNFSNSWQNTQNSGKFVPLRDEEVRIMIRGCKQYELSNHLGNALVTVSDRKSSRASSTTATLAEYYVPYVLTISDYYALGSSIKERTVSFSATYRYGFNNQEQDTEMGEYYAFEYRIHDARLGRFLSVDPLAPQYPWNSCYAFAENTVIQCKDLEGLEKLSMSTVNTVSCGTSGLVYNTASINIELSYKIISQGNGAVLNYQEYLGKHSLNTSLLIKNWDNNNPQKLEELSNREARLYRKAKNLNNANISNAKKKRANRAAQKLLNEGINVTELAVGMTLTVEAEASITKSIEWLGENPNEKGIISSCDLDNNILFGEIKSNSLATEDEVSKKLFNKNYSDLSSQNDIIQVHNEQFRLIDEKYPLYNKFNSFVEYLTKDPNKDIGAESYLNGLNLIAINPNSKIDLTSINVLYHESGHLFTDLDHTDDQLGTFEYNQDGLSANSNDRIYLTPKNAIQIISNPRNKITP